MHRHREQHSEIVGRRPATTVDALWALIRRDIDRIVAYPSDVCFPAELIGDEPRAHAT
jgi:hypothetical protein